MADSVHKMLRTLSLCQPLNLEPQMGSLAINAFLGMGLSYAVNFGAGGSVHLQKAFQKRNLCHPTTEIFPATYGRLGLKPVSVLFWSGQSVKEKFGPSIMRGGTRMNSWGQESQSLGHFEGR